MTNDPAPTRTTLRALLELLLPEASGVMVSNRGAAVELRGDELVLRDDGAWLTLHHAGVLDPEHRSHAHVSVERLRVARVVQPDGDTPLLCFWEDGTAAEAGERPLLALVFPAFYDWDAPGHPPLEANRERFREWLAEHGAQFELGG